MPLQNKFRFFVLKFQSEISRNHGQEEELLLSDEKNSEQLGNASVSQHHHSGTQPSNHDSHHGHSHYDPEMFFKDKSSSMFTFFILMFATSIHSLFEGMFKSISSSVFSINSVGLALGLQADLTTAIHLFIGIIIHECLVAVALGLSAVRLQQEKVQLRMHLKFAFLFSLTIPVGNILGILLGYTPGHVGRFISAIFQGFAAGTFIHVTFLELIPGELLFSDESEEKLVSVPAAIIDEDNHHGHQHHGHQHHGHQHGPSNAHANIVKMKKILLLLFGFLLMSLVPFLFGDDESN